MAFSIKQFANIRVSLLLNKNKAYEGQLYDVSSEDQSILLKNGMSRIMLFIYE